MSKSDTPQVVILCEDLAQYHFARKFLQLHSVTTVFQKKAPPAQGAAEHWVREKFPAEVRAYRAKSAYRNIALAVMTDADRYSVAERKRQLDSSLTLPSPGQAPRGRGEKIAIFVPKWSLETWFRFLDGAEWYENISYKMAYRDAAPTEYARILSERCRQPQPLPERPESLADACEEWVRLGLR